MDQPAARHSGTPVLRSLAHYQRSWLVPDLVAGLTLLVIAVPEQLATSRLAGMPPITGLYAFVAGTVAFALVGSNPQMSVGADSTIAPLFAVGLAHFAPLESSHYIALAGLLAVMAGAIVALVGLLHLGWIAEFLSVPIITGFLAGVAVIIVVHQLPDVLGLPSVSGSTIHRVATVFRHIGHANVDTVLIALCVLAVVAGAERVDRRLPGALVGLVGSTLVVAAAQLESHGVSVIGTVAHSAPHVGLRDLSWSTITSVFPIAAVVALVIISQSAATTRAFADLGDYDVDVGVDFVGVGAGSVLSGLFGSFAVDASPARTAAVASAGGRSQLSGLAAAAAVVLLVPAAGVLHDVPVATLGAILIFVASRIFHLKDLVSVARFDRIELGLALVTLLVVALAGVEQGIAVAVALAILDRTRLSARPSVHILGRVPGTTSWAPIEQPDPQREVPGVRVLIFAASLYYANAQHFRTQVRKLSMNGRDPVAPRLVLDVAGMYDLDFTGARVLTRVLDELHRAGVRVDLARVGHHVRQSLERSGLLAKIGEQSIFDTVDEAVNALDTGTGSANTPAGAPPA
ncbi:MAG: SulP family inorganic anion transporter [Acidimicrobiales bacterium]